MKSKLIYIALFYIILTFNFNLQAAEEEVEIDSTKRQKQLLKDAKVENVQKNIKMTIRNVDISSYPIIKLIVEAYDVYGNPLDTMYANDLSVLENGIEKKVISVEKISINDRIPVDFVFVIDQTGSMQNQINSVRRQAKGFAKFLKGRGIDYTLSLILFSDMIEQQYQPTEDIDKFLGWLAKVKADGGGDIEENALKGLSRAAKDINYRPSANKVVLLITDAPYHEANTKSGKKRTNQTTESIIKLLQEKDIRVFSITPKRLKKYSQITNLTRGNSYDIDYPFSSILDNFSTQLTNLYKLRYKTLEPAIPDSINIAIINEKKQLLTEKTIPIVELGRKLIIQNMLYGTGKSNLPVKVPELDVLTQFMQNRKNVVIRIEGHTDAIGSYAVNDRLSLQRAKGVKQYLLNKGISKYRVKTKGFGERRPISSNKTDFGRKLNRRTEIIIIAK